MTAPSAPRHAGGDAPNRRPAPSGWSAARAALLLLLGLLLAASLAGPVTAQEPASPLVIGPGPALPLPPPTLPGGPPERGSHRAAPKGHHKDRADRGHRAKHGRKDAKDALELQASCAPLSLTQTYSTWGPAVAYGMPVTVLYEAERCSTPDGSALDVSAQGTAKISSSVGELLDTRPFLVTGTWRQPENAEAWPPPWWTCSVPYASYTWEIPGIYSFRVSAREGVWVLEVSSRGIGSQDVSWTHDGCA